MEEQLSHSSGVVDVCYSLDGTSICACCVNGHLQIYSQQPGQSLQLQHSWSVPDTLTKVACCHPEFGTVIAAAAHSGTIYIWRITSQGDHYHEDLQAKLQHSKKPITCVSFAPKQHGLFLAAAGVDGTVRLYSASSLASPCSWPLEAQFQVKHDKHQSSSAVSQLCWRPGTLEGPAMLAVGSTGGFSIWEYDSGYSSWANVKMESTDEALTCLHWSRVTACEEMLMAACGRQIKMYSIHADALGFSVEQLEKALDLPASVTNIATDVMGISIAVATDAPDAQVYRLTVGNEWKKGFRIATVPYPPAMGSFLTYG